MPTRCLSFHAAYRCRHSGACCHADWDIEVDPRIIGVTALPRTSTGECGFHQDDRCALQVKGGEAMLPSACRHFPRVLLRDARGTLLTLSHFCPTAAALLFEEGDVSIVEAAPPLALDEPLEGLDARDVLPPLLRPGMLTDVAGYDAWERAVVRTLVQRSAPDAAFQHITSATERARRWLPSDGPLADAVGSAFNLPGAGERSATLSRGFELVRGLVGPHPLIEVPEAFAERWARMSAEGGEAMNRVVSRYLAATAFGNWLAYRGQGLRTIVEWLKAAYDVLRIQAVREDSLLEAIRQADWIMVHTVDSQAFGRAAVSLEY